MKWSIFHKTIFIWALSLSSLAMFLVYIGIYKLIESKVYESFLSLLTAVGTVGAVLVSLWLAQKGDFSKMEYEKRLQRLHAIRILPLLKMHNEAVRNLNPLLIFGSQPSDGSAPDYEEIVRKSKEWSEKYQDFKSHSPISIEAITLLSNIPSMRISRALGLLDALSYDIENFKIENYHFSYLRNNVFIKEWTQNFSEATRLLNTSIKMLEESSNLSEILPKEYEL